MGWEVWKNYYKCLGLSTCVVLISMNIQAEAGKWSYQGDTAPDHWSKNQEYQRCSGYNQSPIDIRNTVKAGLAPLKFNYAATTQTIVNNGHTVQINFTDGGTLQLDGDVFTLKQFHLHTPSENQIDGKSYPMEAHFVHVNQSGALAVVGVMYEEGEENLNLGKLWHQLPKAVNAPQELSYKVQATDFLPKQQAYYRFNGSLTTPPCTEGVRWMVFKNIQKASSAQIKQFAELMHHNNSRPVQPINARVILE